MKTKTFFMKRYLGRILIVAGCYTITGFFAYQSGRILYEGIVFVMALVSFLGLNRRVTLYEDKIIIVNCIQKIQINFDFVKNIKMGSKYQKFSKENISELCFRMKNNKTRIFYCQTYLKDSVIEIIEYALIRNNQIRLDANVKEYIGYDEVRYNIKRYKRTKQIIWAILIAAGCVAVVIKMV